MTNLDGICSRSLKWPPLLHCWRLAHQGRFASGGARLDSECHWSYRFDNMSVFAAVLQAVYEWNKQAPAKGQAQSMRVLLGGSEVLNSDMFLKALGAA